jgi:hypothetical protein
MGWCSGTEIFDPVAKYIINSEMPAQSKRDLLKVLINALEDHDWDCQQDSGYYNFPIVERAFLELHPDWREEGADDE